MIQYKLIKINNGALNKLGEDGWILSCINDGIMYFYKQSKKERLPKLLLIDDFDEFYRMYPQKKAKKDAQVMWSRLDEKSKTLAVEGLKRYIVYWNKKGIEKQYLPHPATWINGKRWEDTLDDTIPRLDIEDKYKKEQEEERKLEQDRLWMESQLAKLKASGKWDEWYNQAKEETPENQRQYEMLILTRIKQRIRYETPPI